MVDSYAMSRDLGLWTSANMSSTMEIHEAKHINHKETKKGIAWMRNNKERKVSRKPTRKSLRMTTSTSNVSSWAAHCTRPEKFNMRH